MNKTLEKPFLAAFGGLQSPVAHCIDWMNQTYDLGVYPSNGKPLPQKWQVYYNDTLPKIIKEQVEAFDETVVTCGNPSPLMEEIENNLNKQPTKEAKEQYIFSLLTPFKTLTDKYTPIALIAQEEKAISDAQNNLAMWEKQSLNKKPHNTTGKFIGMPEKQIEAYKRKIEKHRQNIERYKYISDRYKVLTGHFDDEGMQEDTVEAYLSTLYRVACNFADRLDALLLIYGIDLLRLERESGVYLKEYRTISDVDSYIGSRELAQHYIDALPKNESGKPQPKATELPEELNTDKARAMFQKTVEARFMTVEAGYYKWKTTKALLAYYVIKATDYLKLKTTKHDACARWEPFETLLGEKNLKGARSDGQRFREKLTPIGKNDIDALFAALSKTNM